MKKENKNYHLFLFLSFFARGLVEPFSLVMLYKRGFSIQSIMLFLLFTYFLGMVTCYISIRFYKKWILILSNVLYGVSFVVLSYGWSIIFFGIIFAFSQYSFHVIRHYYALCMYQNRDKTYFIVCMIYLGIIFSSVIGSFLLNMNAFFTGIIVFFLSFFACIPMFWYADTYQYSRKRVSIGFRKVMFSILEQFKVLFMEMQPLFLYLYVKKSYVYIGIFQFVMNLSSLILGCFFVRYISYKHFKYVTLVLGCILFFKIFGDYRYLMLIAFLEGIFVKIYEMFSLRNLYQVGDNDVSNYLIREEFIFLGSKILFMLLCIMIGFSFKGMLLFFIVGIILSGFFI